MRKVLLTILLITLSSGAAAALWKCTNANGAVSFTPTDETGSTNTCTALTSDEPILSSPSVSSALYKCEDSMGTVWYTNQDFAKRLTRTSTVVTDCRLNPAPNPKLPNTKYLCGTRDPDDGFRDSSGWSADKDVAGATVSCKVLSQNQSTSTDPQQNQQRAREASDKCFALLMNDQEIKALVGKMTLDANENAKVTPAMLALKRRATPKERKAREKYIIESGRCGDEYIRAGNMAPFDRTTPEYQSYLQPLLNLRDGQITFADYAREEVKAQKETERIIKEFQRLQKDREAKERQAAEQERRHQEELNRPITLSCLVDMQPIGVNIPRINGVEWQYQINEAAQTIWASRGAIPTKIRIGPTDIYFVQDDQSVSISRNTGRISLMSGRLIATGICQTITQRKF